MQCPDQPSGPPGCSVPQGPNWAPRYDMASSSYMYCFNHCQLDWLANHTELGVWAGVVGVDHYWTHQGMPCIDGVPQEFQLQDAFTLATKAAFPRSRVLQYRITTAVPYAGVVHDKMVSDPGAFVRWTHAPTANGSICAMPYVEHGTGLPSQNCSWEIRAAAYNFADPAVQQWWVDTIIKPTMVHADGAWIDGDGPDNGAWMCSGSYDHDSLPAPYPALNVTEIASFCAGEAAAVVAAQQWLIANGGFDYNCMTFVTSGLPEPGDAPATCAAKVLALAQRPADPFTVLYGDRTDSRGYDDETVTQAVATFLLVRREQYYFGFMSGSNSVNASTAAVLLTDFGAPLANMSAPSSNVWSRPYEKATVSLDCNTFTASFTPTAAATLA